MSRWSMELLKKLRPDEYARIYGKKDKGSRSKNKYGAKRTGKGAEGYDSLLEERVGSDLHMRVKAGEITDIHRQVTIVLQDGGPKERITWKLDFSFINVATGVRWYAEAKGVEGERYRLLLKLYRANPPGPLEIWKGTHKKPILVEVIGA